MIAKVLLLLLGVTALSHSRAEASDGLSEAVADFLNMTVEEEPEQAGIAAELLFNLYDGDTYPRDEKILRCLKEVQRCWKGVISNAAERQICVASAQSCRKLVLETSPAPLPVRIEEHASSNLVLVKTLNLCGEKFDVSKLHQAAATDANLALAIRHMAQKGVRLSSYCYIAFLSEAGAITVVLHPIKPDPETLGSPSPGLPSYEVTIDGALGQATFGHYVK